MRVVLPVVLMLLSCTGGLLAQIKPAGNRPNVLFILSDDQRFDTIHALGNPEIITPTLDGLAKEGFAFTRAHIMGGTQPAVCAPSRAMLMTGRTLFHATVAPGAIAIPAGIETMPETFKKAGYRTIGIGKWHNDKAAYARSFQQGGAIFFGGMNDHSQMPVFDFDPAGTYPKSQVHTGAVFSTELFANTAIHFLEAQEKDTPFFLYVAFTAPHDPRMPPKAYADLYDPQKIALPPNFMAEHPFDNGELKIRDEKLLPWPRTPDAVRKEIALYYAMITHLDAEIGRILAALEKRGLRDNTVIIFAGDNGLALGQHGLLGKQNLYEHSVRVPLIFAGPGIPRGKQSDALGYLLDVFPTLCDLAGLKAPATVEGKSLAPVMRGEVSQVRDSLFAAYREVQRMVRDPRWKAIYYPQINRWQLFDLAQDPAETRDLSSDSSCAQVFARLKGQLTAWQKELDDPLLKRRPTKTK